MKYINKDHEKAAELHQQGKFNEAIALFEKVLEANPSHPDVLSDRATCYLVMEKYNLAIIDFNEAVDLEPKRAFRYASRAFAKDKMGDFDGAIRDYEKAIELDPDDAIAHNNLGVLMENRGYKKKAQTLYSFADKLNEDSGNAFTPAPAPNPENASTTEAEEPEEEALTQKDVVKSLFTGRGLKDFFRFVLNGFKLPK